MSDVAYVKGDGLCPRCGAKVIKLIRCQWGLVPHACYLLGDPVEWLRDSKGQVVSSFKTPINGPNRFKWNCGDPQFSNVILFDVLFDSDLQIQDCNCTLCGISIAAAAVVVADGRFKEIRVLTSEDMVKILGSSQGKADIVIIREDGTFWPREDWYDVPLTSIEGQ